MEQGATAVNSTLLNEPGPDADAVAVLAKKERTKIKVLGPDCESCLRDIYSMTLSARREVRYQVCNPSNRPDV